MERESTGVTIEADSSLEQKTRRWSVQKVLFSLSALLALVLLAGYLYLNHLNQAPNDFPLEQPVTIKQGTDVREIASLFAEAGVVRSANVLYYALVLLHDPTELKASTYVFTEPLSTTEVAERLTEGDFDSDLIRFTHIEGEPVAAVAARASSVLPAFDNERFLKAATPQEGMLFPDTYFVPLTYTDEELLTLMRATFDAHMKERADQISKHMLTEEEIVILASIIEREAKSEESKKLVAGILLNRLENDMPLQADASIEYILDKPLSELTPEDLKIESPYNTYLNQGLPPTPIGNPGLAAIDAVLEPTASDYFYYLTDSDGVFHYAETYAEHQQNIARYLR